jgi:hypothetical protein
MSSRRGKSSRRSGHPARAAARQAPETPTKARAVKRARPSSGPPAPRRAKKSPSERGRIRRTLAGGWAGLLHRMLTWTPGSRTAGETAPLADRDRTDLVWAVATGVVSAILFATVLSSQPALSDATESTAGVASLGILHAPGYPSYVLVARAFTLLEPFGDMALRVGLFSLVCASLSVVLVQLLARRCGASRIAASLGALCLAASAGYWYYAGFTKHDQFSGLTFLLALYLLLSWEAKPTSWRLVAFAAALGIGLGSSWPLTIMLGPVGVFVLARSWRRISPRAIGVATVTGAVLVVAAYGFVMVRAAENPVLNWGDATSVGRVIDLIERSDFSPGASYRPPASSKLSAAPSARMIAMRHLRPGGRIPPAAIVSGSIHLPAAGLINYLKIFWHEFGVVGSLLALWGAAAALFWRRRRVSVPLLIVFLTNLLGTLATVAPGASDYSTALIEEGFILGCYFVLAVWVALGAADLLERGGTLLARAPAALPSRATASALGTGLSVLVLIPLLIVGWPVAHRSDNAYADSFGKTALSEVAPRSVLFVWGADLNFPMEYRQIVYHQRPDVVVVAIGGLKYGWYRQEIGRALGRPLPAEQADTQQDLANVVRWAEQARPVYLDNDAAQVLSGTIRSQPVGLVARVVSGRTSVFVPGAQLEHTLLTAERAAGMPSAAWNVWPNNYLLYAEYTSLGLKAAQSYFEGHNLTGMRQALDNVARIQPSDSAARRDLSLLNQSTGGS